MVGQGAAPAVEKTRLVAVVVLPIEEECREIGEGGELLLEPGEAVSLHTDAVQQVLQVAPRLAAAIRAQDRRALRRREGTRASADASRHPRKTVEPDVHEAKQTAGDETDEEAQARVAVQGPTKRVGDDEPSKAVVLTNRHLEGRRPRGRVNDEYRISQVERLHDPLQQAGGVFEGPASPYGPPGQSEAGEIDGDAAVPLPQLGNRAPVHEAPHRAAVDEQHGRARAFVDVVHRVPVEVEKPAVKRELRPIEPGGGLQGGECCCHAPWTGGAAPS